MSGISIDSRSLAARHLAAGRFGVTEIRFAAGTTLARHSHPRGCLAVVVDGCVRKTYSHVTHEAARGAVIVLPDEEPHADMFGTDGATLVVVEAEQFFSQRLAVVDDVALAIAHRMRAELSRPDEFTPLALEGLALELTAQHRRRSVIKQTPADDAAEILRARFRQPPSLEELAAEVGLTPGLLARCFRARHRQTIGAYLRAARLEWAVGQLIRTDASLAEIAHTAGFADQSHFTRSFTTRQGMPPGRYRALYRPNKAG